MRRVCAWCNQTLGYKCPYCGAELADGQRQGYKTCPDCLGGTTIHFAIEHMQVTHGICDGCAVAGVARVTNADARSIAALDGAGNRGEPHAHKYAKEKP